MGNICGTARGGEQSQQHWQEQPVGQLPAAPLKGGDAESQGSGIAGLATGSGVVAVADTSHIATPIPILLQHPRDQEYLPSLQTEFKFQGYIAETEKRGINLEQLQRVISFATTWAPRWRSGFKGDTGQALSMDMVNLYHLNTWMILPGTEAQDCAFVEVLSSKEQVALWFVSHWWGECVLDFLACIQRHTEVRKLGDAPAYWVCAYANRQHSLSQDLVLDPKETSFYRAMQLAEGLVLILDSKATPFTRIWCAFEETMALIDTDRKERMLLDIASSAAGEAHVLTDGIAEADCYYTEEIWGGSAGHVGDRIPDFCLLYLARQNKAKREQHFPIDVLRSGIQAVLEKAQASVEDDRVRILNRIAGRDLLLPPLEAHENYRRVNSALHAIFALAAWPQLADMGLDVVKGWELSETLKADEGRTSVCLDFSERNQVDDEVLADLASGLSWSVEDLELIFFKCSVTDKGVVDLAEQLPRANLKRLHLGFGHCPGVTHDGVLALMKQIPATVQQLSLDFHECYDLYSTAMMAIADNLPAALTSLILHFTQCQRLDDEALARLARQFPEQLQDLELSLHNCRGISDKGISSLIHNLPPKLKSLRLILSMVPGIMDTTIADLGKQLSDTTDNVEVVLEMPPSAPGNFHSLAELRALEPQGVPVSTKAAAPSRSRPKKMASMASFASFASDESSPLRTSNKRTSFRMASMESFGGLSFEARRSFSQ